MTSRGWLLVGVAGILVVLLSAGRVWFEVSATDVVVGRAVVSVSGSEATRLAPAAALLAGASLLGGLIGARPVRWVAGGLLVLAGALAVTAVLVTIAEPAQAVAAAVATRTGVTGSDALHEAVITTTAWPWSTVTGGICIAGAGVLRWITPARAAEVDRERRTDEPAASGRTDRGARRGDWERLTEGEDPTVADTDDGAADDDDDDDSDEATGADPRPAG